MSEQYDAAGVRLQRFARLDALPFEHVSGSGGSRGWDSVRQIVHHREMLDLMVRRDLKARYKDSSLGFLWSLVRPLTQLFVYYVVVGHFLGAARGIPDFAIFIFAGLTIFGLFSEIVQGGVGSIVANAGLVKKIYLPREIFPLASIGSAMFNFVIQVAILFVATVVAGAFPLHLEILYALPAFAIVLVYGCAFALFLAATNVYLRDIQYLVEVMLMLLMWASPIVYSWTMVRDSLPGWALDIYTNNPVTLAVLGFQRAFWTAGGDERYPGDLLLRSGIALVVGVAFVVLSHRVFRRLQGDFAQAL